MSGKNENCENPEGVTFEKALEKLESVVEKMESGNLSLDEMMKCFEEGSRLSSICEKKLRELEKKIEVLVGGESDNPEWAEFAKDEGASKTAKPKNSGRTKKTEETKPGGKDTDLPF